MVDDVTVIVGADVIAGDGDDALKEARAGRKVAPSVDEFTQSRRDIEGDDGTA